MSVGAVGCCASPVLCSEFGSSFSRQDNPRYRYVPTTAIMSLMLMARSSLYMAVCLWLLGIQVRVQATSDFEIKCLSFTPEVHIGNSTRQVLEYVSAGVNLSFPYNDPTCARPSQVVSANLCRIALEISTSQRSRVTFELWLPETWSGRILGTGNGGIDGCV